MKRILLLMDRFLNAASRKWRNYLFFAKTGQHANLVGDINLINKNLKFGRNVTIYPGVMFWGDGSIVVGNNVDIGKDTVIYASQNGGVIIGDNTNIAAQCYIIDMDHGMALGRNISEQDNVVSSVSIGSDCWIGANATILRGSNINDGAVIGAKSLVKSHVAANTVVAGIPAKKIKERT